MPSTFIWYELLTNNVDDAARFYGAVLGWTVSDSGQEAMDYRYLSMNGVGVGGLLAMPPGTAESGMQPGWLGYISVANVDQSIARILEAGGTLCMPATDIPGVGRLAMLADPQGALFYVMTPTGQGPATSFAPGKPGHGGWHELRAKDWRTAFDFYARQFGWQKAGDMDMGALGTYLQFNVGSGPMIGGMMTDAQAAHPHWLYCFNVDDIDRAQQRLIAHGGQAVSGPHPVPTGEWIIHARDPQAVAFVLVGPRGKRHG